MAASHHDLTPSPDQSFGKKIPQYNSFRMMKQKVWLTHYNIIISYPNDSSTGIILQSSIQMKRGLKLRRFRSEVNIEDSKCDPNKGVTLSLEPRGAGEADATELLQSSCLSHAVSQPDMLSRVRQPSPKLRLRPSGALLLLNCMCPSLEHLPILFLIKLLAFSFLIL